MVPLSRSRAETRDQIHPGKWLARATEPVWIGVLTSRGVDVAAVADRFTRAREGVPGAPSDGARGAAWRVRRRPRSRGALPRGVGRGSELARSREADQEPARSSANGRLATRERPAAQPE